MPQNCNQNKRMKRLLPVYFKSIKGYHQKMLVFFLSSAHQWNLRTSFYFSFLFFPTFSFLLCPRERACTKERKKEYSYPSPRYGTVVEEKRRNASFLGSSCDDVRVMLQLGQAKPPLPPICFLSSRGGKVKGARSVGVSVKRIYMH